MQRTLFESLVDYDIVMLNALAEMRGEELSSSRASTAAQELADLLLGPTSVAIALADLSAAEMEALHALQSSGGWMESHRFARQYGVVREMGAGRLTRERPWQSLDNPAEGLWYKGLAFKGFWQDEASVMEVVHVPHDLLQLLPPLPPSASSPSPGLSPIDNPPFVSLAVPDMIEDVFQVLVHCRNYRVSLDSDGNLSDEDRKILTGLSIQAGRDEDYPESEYLRFLIHICRAANLVLVEGRQLAVNREPALRWLQAPAPDQLGILQVAWRDSPEWNDLWQVPSLNLRATGWTNDSVAARRAVLDFLLGCEPHTWYELDDLVSAMKEAAPDFQRAGGEYNTWYVHDLEGESLMGFEHWDQVDGALIHYLVTAPLHWLGAVDVGCHQAGGKAAAFRIKMPGLLWSEATEVVDDEDRSPVGDERGLAIGDDFLVRVSPGASLYLRIQLARFADFVERLEEGIIYRISPEGVARAQRQGITLQQMAAFLKRHGEEPVPASVLDAVSQGKIPGAWPVRLEQAFILQVENERILARLREDPEIGSLLGESVGALAVVVPRDKVQQVRRHLVDKGYLKR